ncbi:MAG: hypothetical protein NTV33_11475, partial [Coprothermobacterota bacterium]|nr:hypothetical protein [Coprothermobacterota bacterium]
KTFTLTIAIPLNATPLDLGNPPATLVMNGSQQYLKWDNEVINPTETSMFTFKVKLRTDAPLGDFASYASLAIVMTPYLPTEDWTTWTSTGPLTARIGVNPNNPRPGDLILYQCDVRNTSATSALFHLTIPLPPLSTLVETIPPAKTVLLPGGLGVVWENQELTGGALAPYQFKVQLDPNAPLETDLATYGELEISSYLPEQSMTTWTASANLVARIGVNPSNPRPGDSFSYTAEVRNTGVNATTFDLGIPLPSATTIIDATPGGNTVPTPSGLVIVWPLQGISSEQTLPFFVTLQLDATAPIGANLVTHAHLDQHTYTPTEGITTWTATGPLAARIGVNPSNPKPGDQAWYTCEVKNNSAAAVTYTLTIPIPAGTIPEDIGTGQLVNEGGAQYLEWANQTILAGGIGSFTFLVRIPAALPHGTDLQTRANLLVVLSTYSPEEDQTTYTSSGALAARIGVSPSNPRPGDTITYTCTVENSGTAPANVTMTVTLPALTSPLDLGTPQALLVMSGGTQYLKWDNQVLAVGANIFSFHVRLAGNAPFGTVLSTQANLDRYTSQGITTAWVASGGLQSRMRVSPANPRPGDFIQYACEVQNIRSSAVSYEVLVPIPDGTVLQDLGTPPGTLTTTLGLQALNWIGQTLAGGASQVSTFQTLAPLGTSPGQTFTTTGFLTSIDSYVPRTATTPYKAKGNLVVQMTANPANPTPGSQVTYTCRVLNPSSQPSSFTLTASIPPLTTIFGSIPQATILTDSSSIPVALRWSGQSVAAGGEADFTFAGMLSSSAPVGTSFSVIAHLEETALSPTPGPIALPWVYFDQILRVNATSNKNFLSANDTFAIGVNAEGIAGTPIVTTVLPLPGDTATLLDWTGNPDIRNLGGVPSLVWPYQGLGSQSAGFQASGTGTVALTPVVYLHGAPSQTSTISAVVSAVDSGVEVKSPVQYEGALSFQVKADTGTPLPGQIVTFSCQVSNYSIQPQVFFLRMPLPT